MSARARVVVTDASFPELTAERRAAESAGAQFERRNCTSAEQVRDAVAGANVAVVQFAPLERAAISALAPGAAAIRYGVGYNNFDIGALVEFGVRAAYVPDYCTAEVADHTAACILSLFRRLQGYDHSVRAGAWDVAAVQPPVKSFANSTVGFIGFGRIAREVFARLKPFGLSFLVHDPHIVVSDPGLRQVGLDACLAQSDCVSLHVPLTRDTSRLIGRHALEIMQPTAFLVNAARGELIDESALAEALLAGKIAGAALDVFVDEPLPPGSPLRDAPNLQLSPHVAWFSEASIRRLQAMVAEEILRALEGRPLRCPVPGT